MTGLAGVSKVAKLVGAIVIPIAFVAILAASIFAYLFFRNKKRHSTAVRSCHLETTPCWGYFHFQVLELQRSYITRAFLLLILLSIVRTLYTELGAGS